MADYPKPDGYVGSGSDGDMVRTGTGGRKSLILDDQNQLTGANERRNEVGLDYLPGEEL